MFVLIENTELSRKRSFGGSILLHAVVVVLLLTVIPDLTFTLTASRAYNVTLTVPVEPLYLYEAPKSKPLIQPKRPDAGPVRMARKEGSPAKPVLTPPEKPIEPPKIERAEVQPVLKPTPVATDKRLLVETAGATPVPVISKLSAVVVPPLRAEAKIDRPVEPAVVGMFEVTKTAAVGSRVPGGAVEVGGFGNGGSGQSGSGSGPRNGSGLGSAFKPDSRGGGTGDAGFGEARVGKPSTPKIEPEAVTDTPVEIIFKPRPQYTEEARNLKIEGAVSLRVLFTAQGEVRVLETVRGLGHGLDEIANQVARQIRFKPALRNGAPVDSRAIVQIIFQLAY